DSLVLAYTKDLGDFVGGEAKHSQLSRTLEDLVDRGIPPKEEIAAVLDLVQRVVAPQINGRPVLLGELRTQHQRPIIQALANHLGGEGIGGCVKRLRIRDRQTGVIVLAKADAPTAERGFDVVVSMRGGGGLDARVDA